MAKIMFNTGSFAYNGTTYYVTSLKESDKYTKVDVTDTGTTGNGKEFVYGRVEQGFNVEMWASSSAAVPVKGASKACTLNFNGITFAGSASLESVEVAASIDQAVKLTVVGTFDGAVTQS